MRLPLSDAKLCISLLDDLDMFALKIFDIAKKGDIVTDLNDLRATLREHWQKDSNFIEKFISSQKKLSEDKIRIIRDWKGYYRQNYIIMKHYKEYSIFSPHNQKEEDKFFGVLGLTQSIKSVIPQKPPILLETSLLPYKGQIIWDGIVRVSNLLFGKNMTKSFRELSDETKENGEVILQF
ncbi:MAG: hypothetical protein ABIA74_02905 [bacterium]